MIDEAKWANSNSFLILNHLKTELLLKHAQNTENGLLLLKQMMVLDVKILIRLYMDLREQ